MIDPTRQIAELERHEPMFDDATIEAAKVVIFKSRQVLALSASPLADYIFSMMRVVYTSAIDTAAVSIAGDGFKYMMVNPEYMNKLGSHESAFVLAHEAMHLVYAHLYVDPGLRRNPNWELASEACINRHVQTVLGTLNNPRPMPVIVDPATNVSEEQGVNPHNVWGRYRAGMSKASMDFVSEDDFYRTDMTAFSELERLPKPLKPPKGAKTCVHGSASGGPGDKGESDGPGTPQLDPDEVGLTVEQALGHLMHSARVDGNDRAKQELLKIAGQSGDSEAASKMWGDMGLNALRGETVATRRTSFWKQWINNQLHERLKDGDRLRYQRKRAAMPLSVPRLAHRGDETYRHAAIAVDASGSMHTDALEFVASKLGCEDDLTLELLSFDAVAMPFELGEPFRGGGGTNFQCIEEYIYANAENSDEGIPDVIIVFTDGYAPPLKPIDPERWVWLITPGGTTGWLKDTDMAFFEIDTAD